MLQRNHMRYLDRYLSHTLLFSKKSILLLILFSRKNIFAQIFSFSLKAIVYISLYFELLCIFARIFPKIFFISFFLNKSFNLLVRLMFSIFTWWLSGSMEKGNGSAGKRSAASSDIDPRSSNTTLPPCAVSPGGDVHWTSGSPPPDPPRNVAEFVTGD